MGIINPYENINWQTYQKIISTSHAHAKTQSEFDCLYAGGVRHIAVSNYYRSEPFYPVTNGFISGIETVDTIAIPYDCVPCPNAQHHNLGVSGLHMCSIGSFFSSGSPEIIREGESPDRSTRPIGMGGRSWKKLTKEVIDSLQYVDGGGLTINHPTWSELSLENIYKILDYAPQILGIQACNTDLASDLEYWDNVLKTGRKAWGFFVPDHKHKSKPEGNWRGRNVLLVPELTEHACLQSYHNGSFFGKLYNTDLSFMEISLSDKTVTYITNFAESIKIIEDGIITEYQGNSCTHVCQNDVTYVRAEAAGLNDKIYSQPIIFKLYTPPKKDTIFGQKKSKQINNMWW